MLFCRGCAGIPLQRFVGNQLAHRDALLIEAIGVAGSLIGGKYKPLILWHLIDHPLHYMELQRLIPNATPKMLSQQLHDLENNGMIHREVIPEKPPKTIYSLTPFGQSIVPILDAMCQWGNSYLDGLDVQPPCCQSRK